MAGTNGRAQLYAGEAMTKGRDLELGTVLAELRRRAGLIFLCTLLSAGLAFGVSQLIDERYEATADLLFVETNPNAPERTAATNLALSSLDAVMFRVKRSLGSDLPIDELRDQFELEPRGQADIVRVKAEGDTGRQAARRANVLAAEVVAMRRERAQDTIQRQIDALDAQLAQAGENEDLAARIEQRQRDLAVDMALATGDVEIADPAVPPVDPSSPKPVRWAAIAGLLGLLISIGIVLALRSVHRRVGEKEVAEIFDAPILARVPTRGRKAWREQRYLEAFQFLRANVALKLERHAGADPQHRGRLIAVTSPLPGNGKSTVVGALANALALNGSKVLAVDADLRKPLLGEQFGFPGTHHGLTEVLLGHADPQAYIVATPVPSVTLLPGGRLGGNFAVAHATASRLPDVLDDLRSRADVVLIDTAPVALAAEPSILTSLVDDVLLVVDARDLRREALEDTRDQLLRARANLAGIVINRTELPEDKSLKSAYGRPYRLPALTQESAAPAGQLDVEPPESGFRAGSSAR
jgi:capsular exopolysaccharide synthesis family protein